MEIVNCVRVVDWCAAECAAIGGQSFSLTVEREDNCLRFQGVGLYFPFIEEELDRVQ